MREKTGEPDRVDHVPSNHVPNLICPIALHHHKKSILQLQPSMDSANLSIKGLKDLVSLKLQLSGAKPKKEAKAKALSKSESSRKSSKAEKPKGGKKEKEKKKLNKSDSKPQKTETSKASDDSESIDDVLKREALALGADEKDLELIKGIQDDSDAEIGAAPSKNDKSLKSDLAAFVQNLGFLGEAMLAPEDSQDEAELEQESTPPAKPEAKDKKVTKVEEAPKAKEVNKKKEASKAEESAKVKKAEKKPEAEKPAAKADDKVAQNKEPTKPKARDLVDNVKSVNSDKLLIEPRIDWYNTELLEPPEPEKLDRFALERLTERAQKVIDSENNIYLNEFSSNNSQRRFLSQILSDGTLNDKISALTLLVQEAPLHNLKAFDTLLGYCQKKSRTASLQAINALKDLLMNGLLPDRKLVSFSKQPLSKNLDDKSLAVFYYEDHLKKSYFKLIEMLEFLSQDPILHVKMTTLLHIFDLLKAKPEQEANLLRLGVNKLGDVENKVAAKASYQILKLEEAHPAMKKVITDAVTDMVVQRKSDYHAQYYTVLTLNQTILTKKDIDLANALVKTYFSLFERILLESDKALADKDGDKTLGKSETGRKNNRKAFKKGKKGGRSVKVEEKTEAEIADEKSSKMFLALLTGLNRAFPFAELPAETYLAHLDTLYKITHLTNFNTSVQALVLVQQIVNQQDLDLDRFFRALYESLLDPRLVNSSKQGIYLNLLFKSLKSDIRNIPRVLAFVKRILQICSHWLNVGAVIGMCFLLMELSKTHPQILELMEAESARPEASEVPGDDGEYDPKKRNPNFANASRLCLWEIAQFSNHYHPSIATYAESLIDGQAQPKPDLGLFTLAHFLDRFVYKNAKQKSNLKGSSIMQPLGGGHLGSLLVRATDVKNVDVPANTTDWLSQKASEVQPHERFFYEYFSRNENKIRKKKTTGARDSDDEDLDEGEVWDALVKLRPDVEGSDDDLSDFDEADFEDMSDLDVEEDLEGAGEDDEDLEAGLDGELDSDEGMPAMFNDDDDDELQSEEDAETPRKRAGEQEPQGKKKMKLLALPTFASAEDYLEYLEGDSDY